MRVALSASLVVACIAGLAGYWLGFREALSFGVAADFLPRGAIAVASLHKLDAGKTNDVRTMLEFEVDNGLIWGERLLDHPLTNVVGPLWGLDFYPAYEEYITRMARYRKEHPSLTNPADFDTATNDKGMRSFNLEVKSGVEENLQTIKEMVKLYAP